MKKLTLICTILFFSKSISAQSLELIKDINTIGNSNPYGLTVANNKLFFAATDNSGYAKLWVTDGSEMGTVLLTDFVGANIHSLVAFNNKIYFDCNDGINGLELWVSDGTVAGTHLLKDIFTGSDGSNPSMFTVANGKLFFMANDANGEKRLYVTDGTAAGTVVIRNNYIDVLNGNNSFGVMNGFIYFRSDNGSGSGYGLWKSDGTIGGTSLVFASEATGFVPGNVGCNMVVLANKLYFSADDRVYGNELWVTDGTSAGTHIVKNLRADADGVYGGGNPSALTVFNSKIYFMASDDTHGAELFDTDGTAAGTNLVKDIFPGMDGSLPYQINVYNGNLYMICWGTQELWKSDGTEPGTVLVKSISYNSKFTANWNNLMYFSSNNDYSVWQSDGTSTNTYLAKADNSNNPITSYTADQKFTEYNSNLYFSASCIGISSSYELCRFTPDAAAHSFTFIGNGNWSNPANWAGGVVPPSTLMAGDAVTIKGNCIIDITVTAKAGSSIIVATGGSLTINGSLTIL